MAVSWKLPPDWSANILITDAGGLAGLGAVRSLGRAGHRVSLGLAEGSECCPAVRSRFAGAVVHYPDPWKRHREFQGWLADQVSSGQWDFIMPLSEASIAAAAAIRSGSSSSPELLIPRQDLLSYTLSKFHATKAALSAGIACPPTLFAVPSIPDADFRRGVQNLRFPVILKTDNHLTPSGEYRKGRTYLPQTIEETLYLLPDLYSIGQPFMVQEKVAGCGVGSFFLRFERQIKLQFAHRRIHEVPHTGGYSSYRSSSDDPAVLELGRRMLEHIDYDGLAMVEFRQTDSGGLFFLEINGRLWGSLALALHAGVDFPAAHVACQAGRASTVMAHQYSTRIRCRHLPGEMAHLISILRDNQSHDITVGRKIQACVEFAALSANPLIRHDHFWWTDPAPGLVQGAATTRELVAKGCQSVQGILKRKKEGRQFQAALTEQRLTVSRVPDLGVRRILFVCYGNICRSPFAGKYWNEVIRKKYPQLPPADSTGFYPRQGRTAPARIAELVKDQFGCDLKQHESRLATAKVMESADLILVMDRNNYRQVASEYPSTIGRTLLLGLFCSPEQVEIQDPFLMRDPVQVIDCYKTIIQSLDRLKQLLRAC